MPGSALTPPSLPGTRSADVAGRSNAANPVEEAAQLLASSATARAAVRTGILRCLMLPPQASVMSAYLQGHLAQRWRRPAVHLLHRRRHGHHGFIRSQSRPVRRVYDGGEG